MKGLFTLGVLLIPMLVQAQTDSLVRYWHVSIHIGAFVNGVPKHLEESMRSNGFVYTSNGWLGSTSYPTSSEPPIIQAGVERVKKVWSDKWLLSSLRGNVYGYSSVHNYFDFKYRLTTAAYLKGYHSKQRTLRIAAGPALNIVTIKTDRLVFSPATGHIKSSRNTLKAGILAEAGVRYPARSRLFLDFHTQYQYIIGKHDFGTYQFYITDISGQEHKILFQAGKKSFSYFSFNFGLGIRIEKPLKPRNPTSLL